MKSYFTCEHVVTIILSNKYVKVTQQNNLVRIEEEHLLRHKWRNYLLPVVPFRGARALFEEYGTEV